MDFQLISAIGFAMLSFSMYLSTIGIYPFIKLLSKEAKEDENKRKPAKRIFLGLTIFSILLIIAELLG